MKEKVVVLGSEFVTSAVGKNGYPSVRLPEIAFIGRSNVGKSSLINSLLRRKNLARISQTPGKTQTINFYKVELKISLDAPIVGDPTVGDPTVGDPTIGDPTVGDPTIDAPIDSDQIVGDQIVGDRIERRSFYMVDLPGYGYAKVSKSSRKVWSKFIEQYFLTSDRLLFVCQLIDMRHAPMDSDLEMFRWLVANNVPVLVVATKSDKLGRVAQTKQLEVIHNAFAIPELDVLPYSSMKNEGRSELLDAIASSLLQ